MGDQSTPAADRALRLVTGQRWTLAIVAALAAGPMRFCALRSAVPGLSANLLTRRLEALVEADIVKRLELPPPASVAAYALTAWGDELCRFVAELERWARRGRPRPASASRSHGELELGAYP